MLLTAAIVVQIGFAGYGAFYADVVFAKDATLDIMVGGDAALVKRLEPVLKAMGRNIIACGAAGSAHALKALANYVNACALINVIEAMAVGKRYGLDPKLMADALTAMCAGRNHPVAKKVVPPSAGTFPTNGGTYVALLVSVILIMGGLIYFPALALGPIVEQLLMIAGKLF